MRGGSGLERGRRPGTMVAVCLVEIGGSEGGSDGTTAGAPQWLARLPTYFTSAMWDEIVGRDAKLDTRCLMDEKREATVESNRHRYRRHRRSCTALCKRLSGALIRQLYAPDGSKEGSRSRRGLAAARLC